jgi:NADH:ubiquinone oxidoreductase subunit C
MQQCIDIIAIDTVTKTFRFFIYYIFLSIIYNFRIYILIQTNEVFPIESLINIFPNCNWMEREIWDLYGIFFLYHTDLRRILTDYGFFGVPFRKDFPLSGFFELNYDDKYKTIQYTQIELGQNYRVFNFINPWKFE